MSKTPKHIDDLEAAKEAWMSFDASLKAKYGYQIAFETTPEITTEGYLKINRQVVLQKVEKPASYRKARVNTTDNGNTKTTKARKGDNKKRK